MRILISAMTRSAAQEALLQQWLHEHRGIIFKVTRAFARTASEADELRQEIHLQLWKSAANFASQARASTWVYQVCLNTGAAWRRGLRRRESRFLPAVDLGLVTSSAPSPDVTAGEREIIEQLYAAIHALDDFDRALVLLMLDGLSYREIADVIGISEGHVGVALSRARKRLMTHCKGITDELE